MGSWRGATVPHGTQGPAAGPLDGPGPLSDWPASSASASSVTGLADDIVCLCQGTDSVLSRRSRPERLADAARPPQAAPPVSGVVGQETTTLPAGDVLIVP